MLEAPLISQTCPLEESASHQELADKVPEDLDKCWIDLERKFVEAVVPELAMKSATPMATIRSLGVANSMGGDLASLLYEATDLTVLEKKAGSPRCLRSGVRAWNAFAYEVSNYPVGQTFPPVVGKDLEAFGDISRMSVLR